MPAIFTGYTLDCKDSFGGIKTVRLATLDVIDSIIEVDGYLINIALKTGGNFFEFQQVKSVSNFSSLGALDRKTGLNSYSEALNLSFNKMSVATSAMLQKLIKNTLVGVVEDRNGEAFLLGRENGLKITGGSMYSGKASGDKNGYDIQLTGIEKKISHISPVFIRNVFYPSVSTYTRKFENTFTIEFE